MRIHTTALAAVLSIAALGSTAIAQSNTWDIMNYPFITNSTTTVLNLATGTKKAPNGKIISTGTGQKGLTTGKPGPAGSVGFSLSGSTDGSSTKHNYMDTGWKGGMTGSMTIAWDMRLNSTPAIAGAAYYIISGLGSFRIYHNGNGYLGLKIKAWSNNSGPELVLGSGSAGRTGTNAVDLHSMAKKNWIHIAIVIDGTAKTATWYVNATPVRKYTGLTNTVNIPANTATMRVGRHTSATRTSCFDIDNFRLANKVATVAELKKWASQNVTADRFNISARAGGTLNLNIDAGTGNAAKNYLMAGSISGAVPGLTLNGVHIPINFDAWTPISIAAPAAAFVGFAGVLNASGKATAKFIVPANAPSAAVGITFFHSGLVHNSTTGKWIIGTNCNPLVIFP
jgi:Concanavalin A-like lectin/glucanases superfamily